MNRDIKYANDFNIMVKLEDLETVKLKSLEGDDSFLIMRRDNGFVSISQRDKTIEYTNLNMFDIRDILHENTIIEKGSVKFIVEFKPLEEVE